MTVGFKDLDDEDICDLIQAAEITREDDQQKIIPIESLEKEAKKLLLAIEEIKGIKQEERGTPKHNLMRARVLVHLIRIKLIGLEVFP